MSMTYMSSILMVNQTFKIIVMKFYVCEDRLEGIDSLISCSTKLCGGEADGKYLHSVEDAFVNVFEESCQLLQRKIEIVSAEKGLTLIRW